MRLVTPWQEAATDVAVLYRRRTDGHAPSGFAESIVQGNYQSGHVTTFREGFTTNALE